MFKVWSRVNYINGNRGINRRVDLVKKGKFQVEVIKVDYKI